MDIFEKLKKLSAERETAMGKPEYIIVGLGNPGVAYENTRHNAGFLAVAAMEKKYGFSVNTHKFKALVGGAVIGAMDFYDIPLENVVVVYDDISLDVGKMRIRRNGSAGGHNGIKSIIALCGGQDFPRVKIGVGKKPHPDYNLADWVLSRFTDEEMKKLSDVDKNTCEAVELMVQGKINEAMNKFN